MMKTLFPLLLCAALLCGCAAQYPETETVPTLPTAPVQQESPIRDALSMMPVAEEVALRQYRLSETVTGFLPLGENLLFFSGSSSATLTLLNPETGETVAVHEASIVLTPENAAVQLLDKGISYFNGEAMETVVLNMSLQEMQKISAPADMTGMPLLSRDGGTLYYCTASTVRALDLRSGISRVLKETAHPVQSVTSLLMNDDVVQLSITDSDGTWRTLFLSSETGQLLGDYKGNILPQSAGDTFFLCLRDGALQSLLFGGSDPMVLHPRASDADCFFLPESHSVLTVSPTGGGFCLETYDLTDGRRTAALSLPKGLYPQNAAETADGYIWFLCRQESGECLLCRWNPDDSALSDDSCYIGSYYTRENPDYDGLAACSLYAQEIGEKYGIEVLIYKDAVALEPWDYHLEYEYQASVLQRELEALDTRLGNYPAGFLQTLADKFTALRICIVRSAAGSPESGSLDAVNGVQFWKDYDAYIVLAADHDTEYALYHELSHLIETVVLTESIAYDQWEKLNPSDFQYDYDYLTNRTRDGSTWLQEGKASFIDTYSMSFPKEDRARIMEYAMTSGHEAVFRSPYLQAKLLRLCTGIREAFDLKDYTEPLLWEQYLEK